MRNVGQTDANTFLRRARRKLAKLMTAARKQRLGSTVSTWRGGFELRDLSECSQEPVKLPELDSVEEAPAYLLPSERMALFSLIYSCRPRRYLEIGTLHGGSALIVNSAMKQSDNDGRMFLIDPKPQISQDHLEELGERTTLIEGYSPAAVLDAVEKANGNFDFVLIDGDHSYQGVLRDAKAVLPHMAANGYLAFHDTFFDEVALAIEAFLRESRGRVIDLGPLSRDFVVRRGQMKGGLRLLRVTR